MLSEVLIGFLFTFLTGGVVFNVLKEELSEERHGRFRPFASGGAACTALPVAAG